MTRIVKGARVKYSTAFLRSTGMYTGEIPFARGTVTEVKDLGSFTLAIIDWANESIPSKVNIKNLTLVPMNN